MQGFGLAPARQSFENTPAGGRPLLIHFELSVDAGDSFLEDCDRFDPGFEDLCGVACVEVARMRLFGGVSALRLFEFFFEVGQSLF